jgi:hypothetical protein
MKKSCKDNWAQSCWGCGHYFSSHIPEYSYFNHLHDVIRVAWFKQPVFLHLLFHQPKLLSDLCPASEIRKSLFINFPHEIVREFFLRDILRMELPKMVSDISV